ncbi:MAG: hypothetical protein Q9220_004905 [cf. Caloplaca sp. 1 TL-2023]
MPSPLGPPPPGSTRNRQNRLQSVFRAIRQIYQTAPFSRFVRDHGNALQNTPLLDSLEGGSLPSADQRQLTDHEIERLAEARAMSLLRLLSHSPIFNDITPLQHLERSSILTDYRASRFVADLALGRHDGFEAAYHNQEYDSYYTALWDRVVSGSRTAALALGEERVNPHKPPAIALTIPPIYEVSDLPPYTETVLPPVYAVETPRDHLSRDVPSCVNPLCPVRQIGIPHSRGLYHHQGQLGSIKREGGKWLPYFGCSNPPPHVWDAYHHMVLGIATAAQQVTVVGFAVCHGQPWTPHWKNHAIAEEAPAATKWVKTGEDVGLDHASHAENRTRIPRNFYHQMSAADSLRDTAEVPDDENGAPARFVEAVFMVLATHHGGADMSDLQFGQTTNIGDPTQRQVRIPAGAPANNTTAQAPPTVPAPSDVDRGRALYSAYAAGPQQRANILRDDNHRSAYAPSPHLSYHRPPTPIPTAQYSTNPPYQPNEQPPSSNTATATAAVEDYVVAPPAQTTTTAANARSSQTRGSNTGAFNDLVAAQYSTHPPYQSSEHPTFSTMVRAAAAAAAEDDDNVAPPSPSPSATTTSQPRRSNTF